MKRKIVNGLLLMALSVSSVSTFVACKDYDEDVYVDLKSQISQEKSLREALQRQLDELSDFAHSLKQCECKMDEYLKKTEAENLYLKPEALDDYLNKVGVENTIRKMLAEARQDIDETLKGFATKDDLNDSINKVNKTILEVKALTEEAMGLAERDSIRLDSLDQRLNGLVTAWTPVITQLVTDVEALKARTFADSVRIDVIEGVLDSLINAGGYDDTELKRRVATLEGQMAELYPLVEKVRTLESKVNSLLTRMDQAERDIADLQEEVYKLKQDIFNKMITSVIVQAAESPVLGYANTPFGLNATVLAVYYGKPTASWDFPATNATPYVNGSSDFAKWTNRNKEVIGALSSVSGYIKGGANEIIVSNDGEEGNAGTLYLTINPNTVDFDGTLKLVDSQNNEAPAVLSKAVKSDRTLNFGYTRAANNGFYEAKATIDAGAVEKAKLNVDYSAVQEDIKAMVKEHTASSVLELGTTIVKNLTDVTPAYGVAASWTSNSYKGGFEETTHTLYSQYNVAATAIKPLSLAFMNDWKGVSSMPGIDRLQDLVGEIIDKVKINLNLNLPNFDDVNIEFKEITADNVDFSKLTVKVSVLVNNDEAILVSIDGDIYELTYGSTDVTKAKKLVNGQYVDVTNATDHPTWPAKEDGFVTCDLYIGNEMKGVVEDLCKEFNGSIPADEFAKLMEDMKQLSELDGTISGALADAKNDIKSTINSYISRINNKLTKWFNRAPSMMHLTMVANAGNKIGILSQSKATATKATGAVTLFPTTYNLELIAPTYKKFVAVTDVFNADGTNADINLAKKANTGNLGKVIEGNTTLTLNGEKDKIYEVTYTAVDYFGKVAIRKYYVKF